MTLNLTSTVSSFLLAVLIYFLFDLVLNALITNGESNRLFHIILLIICVVIALGGSLFFKIG